jgi:methylenetetrahydrofolate--tRNA-(uracil-5-)-methyltransferase
MHRNTYINSSKLLNGGYQLKSNPNIYFAGQMTGVEGYVESASSGLIAGINMARMLEGKPHLKLDSTTGSGALVNYITSSHGEAGADHFDPMNVNFGIFSPLEEKVHKKSRKAAYGERAIKNMKELIEKENL